MARTASRSADVPMSFPAFSIPTNGSPLVTDPGDDNIDQLIADHVSRLGGDSADDRHDVASAPHETSARAPVLAASARSRAVSNSVNLEFLDDVFLDQAFVDAVTVAI